MALEKVFIKNKKILKIKKVILYLTERSIKNKYMKKYVTTYRKAI